MNLYTNKVIKAQSVFSNYAFSIKEELLNQIINKQSDSRPYFENCFDKLYSRHLDVINDLNYNTTCCNFINDVYHLIPIHDTI